MHPDDGVPVLIGKVDQHAVAQDAGIVDESVEAAELVEGGLHQSLRPIRARDVVPVGHRPTPEGADLFDHFLGRPTRLAFAVDLHSEVVHHNGSTLAGQLDGVAAAEAPPRTGDDGHTSLVGAAHTPPSGRQKGRAIPSTSAANATSTRIPTKTSAAAHPMMFVIIRGPSSSSTIATT